MCWKTWCWVLCCCASVNIVILSLLSLMLWWPFLFLFSMWALQSPLTCVCVWKKKFVCVYVCERVCVYLPSCSIQGLSYTCVVLSPYLYLSSFSFSWYTFFAIITSSFSPFQVSILLWGKLYFFVSFKQISFCYFFLCSLKFLASPFLLNIRSFLSVSSGLCVCVCVFT